MENTPAKIEATPEDALTNLMSLVSEKRTLVQFQIAEKLSRTYRIKAPSWKAAKEMIDVTHDNAGTMNPDYDDEYDCYYEQDGCINYLQEYQPTFDQKIKQVKIGYKWYDLQRLVYDPTYYITRDMHIQRVLDERNRNGEMDAKRAFEERYSLRVRNPRFGEGE